MKRRVKKGYVIKLLTTVFIFSGLLSTLYALYSFRMWNTKASSISSCVPECTSGWCSLSSKCCSCIYGENPNGYGPVTCCTPPGTAGCQTNNIKGCNSQPGAFTPTPVQRQLTSPSDTPTPIPLSCSVSVIPSIYNLRSNQAVNLTASVKTYSGAVVNRVNFSSDNPSLIVSTQADYSYVYQTTASTLLINKTMSAKVTATVHLNGTVETCSGTSTITLTK